MADFNTPEWIDEQRSILESSSEPAALESAAIALASADDPAALDALTPFLTDAPFLARLDDLEDPARKTFRLSHIMMTLIRLASPEIVPLCLTLAHSESFLADPDRKIFLLQALAAAGPMNSETVELFRTSNDEGYFGSNACLLARNGSTGALDLWNKMMLDESVDIDIRVSLLHEAILPIRNRTAIMEFVGRLVAQKPPEEIVNAAVESIYDFQTRWRRGHPDPPPAWRTSSTEALGYLVKMGAALRKRFTFPEPLSQSMDNTIRIAEALLARRGG